MTIYILLLVVTQYLLLIHGQEKLVTTDQGIVRGYKNVDRDLYEFHGIPYATAPTGRDKFKAPLPAPKWEGVLEATDSFVVCPQNIPFIPIPFTEDCLVVNVFVPDNNNVSRPVVVYIHGGAFLIGFGNMGVPYNLVDKDIVAVTFNYRVGPHGFLCLNTEKIPGNAGLKDQVAALRWVKNNIEAFGGNPNDITLAGYSAGSVSAELLLLSPVTSNLFNKVILESGSALSTWAVNPKSLELAQNIAAFNGVKNVDNLEVLEDFFLSLSYQELISVHYRNWTMFEFSPCIESGIYEEAVIVEQPYNTLASGNYVKLPILTGYTDAEGLMFYDDKEEIIEHLNKNFSRQLPPNYDSYTELDESKAIEQIKAFYFDEDVISYNSIRNITDYLTDSYFSYSIVESAKLHAQNSPSEVYLYEFTYVLSEEALNGPQLGATHCAQSFFVLDMAIAPDYVLDETDKWVQNRTIDIWANFIKSGSAPKLVGSEASYRLSAYELEALNAVKAVAPRMDKNGYFFYATSTAKKKKISLMQPRPPRVAFAEEAKPARRGADRATTVVTGSVAPAVARNTLSVEAMSQRAVPPVPRARLHSQLECYQPRYHTIRERDPPDQPDQQGRCPRTPTKRTHGVSDQARPDPPPRHHTRNNPNQVSPGPHLRILSPSKSMKLDINAATGENANV